MKRLPIARNREIVIQELGKEVLIYDLTVHKAYNLNETSAIVFNACDGKTSFDDLKFRNNFTDDIIFLALDELKKENLLEKGEDYKSPFAGMSRREVIRRVGFASATALPVIISLVAPTAASAQSAGSPATSCTAGTLSTGPLVNQGRGSGGVCECLFSFTPVGTTCGRGRGFSAICKNGCQCRRTEAAGPGCGVGNLCRGVCE
jgi:hypothetical protein